MKSDRYHHGGLPAALIEASLQILEETGVEGLSLREAARRAGVSTAAPYRHFSDRNELLGRVGAQGFMLLSAQLREVPNLPADQRLGEMAQAYLSFACSHPNLFQLMMGPQGYAADNQDCDAKQQCFDLLAGAVSDVTGASKREATIGAWSIVHGLALLVLSGRLAETAESPEAVRALAEKVSAIYINGLRTVEDA